VAGWDLAKANKKGDVTIAIIDTGIDGGHPDLKAKLLPGYDAYGEGKEYKDGQGHGTHCAGIAAAIHNDIGVAGFAPDAKLMAVKVLQDTGSGTYAAVADGIAWAAKSKADVLSMSLGGPSSSQAITDAVALAVKNGKLVVAAMGNSGKNINTISYPAATPGVFAVGANDIKDKTASFSQVGKHCAISAPGVNIMSTFPTYQNGIGQTNYGSISGTSMACPGVSGLAALVKSVNPSLKADQIKKIISDSAVDLGPKGWDNDYGAGKINTLAAVKLAIARRK
ncbi:MAG: S8 family peptidase, partial [Candidatus Sericytochromatia bacterium]